MVGGERGLAPGEQRRDGLEGLALQQRALEKLQHLGTRDHGQWQQRGTDASTVTDKSTEATGMSDG